MKIALMQATGRLNDLDSNLAKLEHAAGSAREQRADILLTPELFLCAYQPADVWALDGAAARARVAHVASTRQLWVVASTVEHERGRRFIVASLFGPDGSERTRYRKRNLFGPDERGAFHPGGARPEIVEMNGWRVALGICFDVEFPEFVRDVALRGAQLLLVPTAVPLRAPIGGQPNPLDTAVVPLTVVPTRAFESQLYIAYANQTAPTFCGRTTLADPYGRRIVTAGQDEELVIGEVSLQLLADARQAVNYLDLVRDATEPAPVTPEPALHRAAHNHMPHRPALDCR